MALDRINATALLDGGVTTADIADDAVTTAKINAGAVDTTELADDAVTTAKLATQTGNVDFADNARIRLGDSQDLEIYHNGTENFIDSNVGTLVLRSPGAGTIEFRDQASQVLAQFNDNSDVRLYHNNNLKIATTVTGVDVTGTVTADGLAVSAASANVDVSDTGTSHASQDFLTNSNAARTTIGVERSSGGGLFVGSSGYAAVFGSAGAHSTQIASNNTVRMTLDTSGNLLVGTTSTIPFLLTSGTGAGITSSGTVMGGATAEAGLFNRVGGDGNIINFYRTGGLFGSIGSAGGGSEIYLTGNVSGTAGIYMANSARIVPMLNTVVADNAVDMGHPSYRFDDVFATNGTIQTSDANEKQQIATLTDAEITAAKTISALFKTYKWNSAVESKGDAARTHTGVIAQDVQAAMTTAGLDAGDYAFFTSNTWWETQTEVPAVEADEENGVEAKEAYTRTDIYDTAEEAPEGATERTRMGIRYPELLAFVGAATEQRLGNIETRLEALENA